MKKLLILLVCIIVLSILSYRIFFYGSYIQKDKVVYIYNKTSNIDSLITSFKEDSIIPKFNIDLFIKIKKIKTIKTGKYLLKKDMSLNNFLNTIRIGKQTPINLKINNIRTKSDLASKLSKQLLIDSTSIINGLNDKEIALNFNTDTNNVIGLFIPNTYNVYWTISFNSLLRRMQKEYNRFWNNKRINLAKEIGLSRTEVITLASIISEESNKSKEYKTIAGVYINRINKGIPLMADPTLKYALNDFTLKRILNVHKTVDSPYNTYKYKGLPPGPICIPSIKSIDAVLNYEHHKFIYFCAKEDFSGYHVFAKTLRQHNKNARKYQRALNKLRIFK
ncbi:endolytic transglycosylase MltG [Marinilabiliaceae bacterium JC040]|nr:endolytic transglycosylase MltG [Marinilabiliaceae bacterium JC040]